MASCSFSLRSADHIGDTFKEMFPDSKIAAGFSLSRTSASYMFGEGLATCFKTVIIKDLKKSNLPFTMHFDETSTDQVKKANGHDTPVLVTYSQRSQLGCILHVTLFWPC